MGTITVLNKYACDDLNAIYIGRPSPLGNPFSVEQYGREQAIKLYRDYLKKMIIAKRADVLLALNEIADKVIETGSVNLKCFCKPKACHGDVIREVVLEALATLV